MKCQRHPGTPCKNEATEFWIYTPTGKYLCLCKEHSVEAPFPQWERFSTKEELDQARVEKEL